MPTARQHNVGPCAARASCQKIDPANELHMPPAKFVPLVPALILMGIDRMYARARGSTASPTTRMVMAVGSPPVATSGRAFRSRAAWTTVRRRARFVATGRLYLFRG